MFRPSQSLLFRPMPALNKFILHPPLPLNPRESKQLLNLLSTSFRQALDKEHRFRKDREAETATERTTKHNGTPRQRRRSISDLDHRPTDRHMRSILTNPLFSLPPAAQHDSKPDKDPMEVFDQAVAKGMMNTHYAYTCLDAKKREIVQSAALSVREGMRDSGAGLKVLRWLVSSGTANDNEFLQDEPFAHIFMEYVVAEELQEATWKWIRRAFEDYPQISKLSPMKRGDARRSLLKPLMTLVRAEASGPGNMDAAYLCLSRAAGYLKGLPVAQMTGLLAPPIRFLSSETTMPRFHHSPASESAFDSFLGLVPLLSSRDMDYHFAHLSLFHPARPSADLSLSLLKRLEASQTITRSPSEKQVIQLSLDAAKFLLEHERFDDAQQVMQYLRTSYPHHLGLAQREQLEQAKAEASSLQLLEGLTLA